MNLKYTLYLSLCLSCCFCLLVQTASGQQAYAPEKLGAAVNSLYPELNPIISPDGRTLYFVRANHPENTFGTHDTQDIWYSELTEDEGWSKARPMPEHLNKNRYNAIFGIFNQGNSLLLHGHYSKSGKIWKKRGFSVSHKTETGWSKPEGLKIKALARKNKGLYTTATISEDGEYLVMAFSKRYNSKSSRLFVSRLQEGGNGYSKPKALNEMNNHNIEEAPFLSPDGKTLYFSDNVTGNYRLYKAERLDESGRNWSKPTVINDSVNSLGYNSYFRTNQKGSYGYFTRSIKYSGPDIYQIKLFEENPYILVKGRIFVHGTNQPLDSASTVNFFANQEIVDSVSYQPEDGTYQAYLPLSEKYELEARAYSHRKQSFVIDGRGLIDFTEMEQDFYLKRILHARIEGNLLIRSSNTPVPAAANPQLLVNGKLPDSVYIDPVTNHYKLWLPYGQNYKLQVQARGYKPEPENLKLSHITGYTELQKNLFVDTEKLASVSGTVFDRKTGEPFPADIPLQIILNDSIEANTLMAGNNHTFSLKLPLGTHYAIHAKADGYYPMSETIDLRQEENNIKVLKDLYLAPIEVGQTIRLDNIFFESGKAELHADSHSELDRVIKFLGENPSMKIEVAGHTDNIGQVAANNKLSGLRAKAVADYIIQNGLPEERISSRGYGSSKPEADNETEHGRSLNRRVEFTILEIVK